MNPLLEKEILDNQTKATVLAAFVGYTQSLCTIEHNAMDIQSKILLCKFCIDRVSRVNTEQYERWANEYHEILKQLQDGTL
jgi:hypothetical protein